MDEILDSTTPLEKVYKDKVFFGGVFIGGPLVAGYFFAENFKAIGQPEKVMPTWIITILVTIAIFGGLFLIPEDVNIPNQVIPIAYCAISMGLFKKFQDGKVNEHIAAGGLVHNWWRVIAVAIIGLIVTLGPIFAFSYSMGEFDQLSMETKTYGDTVKNELTYNSNNISEQEVDEIAAGLKSVGYFDAYEPKYLFVEKENSTYSFSLSVISGAENNPEAVQYFTDLRRQLDAYFSENKVEIKLIVDYYDNVVKVMK